jgi:pimeloyl-ACP methyl ester carboxylesterase
MVVIDLSGHGCSEMPEGPASIEDTFACEVTGLVKHLELEDFILVGHSMGGAVAMSYVLQQDQPSPRGLVLVCTAPQLDLATIIAGLAKEVLDDRIKMPRLRDNPDAALIKQHEAQVMAFKPQIMRRDLAACGKFDVVNRLSEITIPSFILAGEHDDVIPPRRAKAFAELLPRADFAVVREADHVPMLEAPDEFNRLLKKYLDWTQRSP